MADKTLPERWTSGSLHRTGESKWHSAALIMGAASKWLHAEARDQAQESLLSEKREPRKSGKSLNYPQSEPLPSGKAPPSKGTEQLSYSETNFKSQGDTSLA